MANTNPIIVRPPNGWTEETVPQVLGLRFSVWVGTELDRGLGEVNASTVAIFTTNPIVAYQYLDDCADVTDVIRAIEQAALEDS